MRHKVTPEIIAQAKKYYDAEYTEMQGLANYLGMHLDTLEKIIRSDFSYERYRKGWFLAHEKWLARRPAYVPVPRPVKDLDLSTGKSSKPKAQDFNSVELLVAMRVELGKEFHNLRADLQGIKDRLAAEERRGKGF